MTTDFFFVRHARTAWNEARRIQGTTDIGLSREGETQAAVMARFLGDLDLDLIVSSGMKRTRDTARIIALAGSVPMLEDRRFMEQDFGEWEGLRLADIRRDSPGEMENQEKAGWDFTPPGGESRRKVLARAMNGLQEAGFENQGGRVLIVTHSSVIKTILYHLLGRRFLPTEPTIVQQGHLHWVRWDREPGLAGLNAMDLATGLWKADKLF